MVQDIDIGKLNEAPYNPRIKMVPGSPDWEKLENSIEEFGNVEPIVWNKRTGNVVGGHQRLAVLRSRGETSIPCSVVDMDEGEEKLLNVALNKIEGDWDYEKLEDLLKEFDYETAAITGFSPEEIAVLLASDDDLMDDEDFDDWDDWEGEFIGGSYVVTLQFDSIDEARDWAAKAGYEKQVKENTNSTVIRIE